MMSAARLILCLAIAALAPVPSALAQRWGGRQCGYQGVWVNDGQELEGDTMRCRCDNGRWVDCRNVGSCRRTQWPPSAYCKYECPANSCVKRGRQCVDSYDDCECASGYMMSNGRCEKNRGHNSCLWQGRSFDHTAWRDNVCQCFDGSWKCSNPPSPPAQERGCTDNFSLPFGLENCVCDGAEVGRAAGLAACTAVATECLDFVSFSVQDNSLEAIQRVCDSLALDGCRSAAQVVPFNNPGCAELLQFGTNKCSAQQANDIFNRSVQFSCEPLCKDCPRRG
mmetsp:Transcript_22590/g.62721  ORF Transcript_22590/g.62721 Transcript_22590/m.62721 type:complete len:281 (+) Transcript_22590:184-1026(+)